MQITVFIVELTYFVMLFLMCNEYILSCMRWKFCKIKDKNTLFNINFYILLGMGIKPHSECSKGWDAPSF
jgi:hypothetical protein